MKKNVTSLILVLIAFVAIIIIALVAYNALRETAQPMSFIPQMIESGTEVATEAEVQAPQQSIQETQEPKMPDIPFYTLDGTETSFEQIRKGRAVVINYWASWCPPCKEELPHFQKAYDTYGEQISFIFLNALDGQRETIQTVTKFIKDFGFTGPVYTDEGLFSYIFQTNSLPTTVFIHADGTLASGYLGYISESVLQQNIELLLR
jgi:thiol-disulfide isomerase/thioredoxin